jgi:hypothetical protein
VENLMRLKPFSSMLLLVAAGLLSGCREGPPPEVHPIAPGLSVNRDRVPLGSALEVTFEWTVGPNAKPIPPGHRAFVHLLDSYGVILLTADHVPDPPPDEWRPGETYRYGRTLLVPVSPYVGEARFVMGLYSTAGDGARLHLDGEGIGRQEYHVRTVDLLPQTENVFLVYKEGWHEPQLHPDNPAIEYTWTKREAVISFRNPKTDVVVYLQAETCFDCFSDPPTLALSVGPVGTTIPIEDGQVFLERVRINAADLGTDEWIDLRLQMSESFVPARLTPPRNDDPRELALLVHHVSVVEADAIGPLDDRDVREASALD